MLPNLPPQKVIWPDVVGLRCAIESFHEYGNSKELVLIKHRY